MLIFMCVEPLRVPTCGVFTTRKDGRRLIVAGGPPDNALSKAVIYLDLDVAGSTWTAMDDLPLTPKQVSRGSQALLVLSSIQMFIAASSSEERGQGTDNWLVWDKFAKKFVSSGQLLPAIRVRIQHNIL